MSGVHHRAGVIRLTFVAIAVLSAVGAEAADYLGYRATVTGYREDGTAATTWELAYVVDAGTVEFRVVDVTGPTGPAGRALMAGYIWRLAPNSAEVLDVDGNVVAESGKDGMRIENAPPLADQPALGPMLATAARTLATGPDAWKRVGTDAQGVIEEASLPDGCRGRRWRDGNGAVVRQETRGPDGGIASETEVGDVRQVAPATFEGLLTTTRVHSGTSVESTGGPGKGHSVTVPRPKQTIITTYVWDADHSIRLPAKSKTYDGTGRLVCMIEYGDYTFLPPIE